MEEAGYGYNAFNSANPKTAEEQVLTLDHSSSISLADKSGGEPVDSDIDLFFADDYDADLSLLALENFNNNLEHPQGSGSGHDSSQLDGCPYPTSATFVQADDECPGSSSLYGHDFGQSGTEQPYANCAIGDFSYDHVREGQSNGPHGLCLTVRSDCHPGQDTSSRLAPEPTLLHLDYPSLRSAEGGAVIDFEGSSLFGTSQLGPPLDPRTTERTGSLVGEIPVKVNALHSNHPYPNSQEKIALQRQTGLNKAQIANWLANARRRGKTNPQKSFPQQDDTNETWAMKIPHRAGTPALRSSQQATDPLQRWVDSPPENEPASARAIARAITSNREGSSPPERPYPTTFTDEDSALSASNAASTSGTGSASVGSFGSAYSHGSNSSLGSRGERRQRHRQRRRGFRSRPKREGPSSLVTPSNRYQCTFCPETFRTKYDWQRHEKSLHLSLERWICTPEGSRMMNPKTSQCCCVFCGQPDPDDAHLESRHNHSTCQARASEEKTFYRKDHLGQHLKLVHNVQFLDWFMNSWKVDIPELRSRCGFCGITMENWPQRVDHLAGHFKAGSTIADWKGDWGFESSVLDLLESAIPPYLIEDERNSSFPLTASRGPNASPRTAYELITWELSYFIANYNDGMSMIPSDDEIQLESCRIIFASEVSCSRGMGISTEVSWLRDLLMASEKISKEAQFAPLRLHAENRLCMLKINGKDNLFEQCPLEQQLSDFVRARASLDCADSQLQIECCHIINCIEEASNSPSQFVANWLLKLITSSTMWLANFRQRNHLPQAKSSDGIGSSSVNAEKPCPTIHSHSVLEPSTDSVLIPAAGGHLPHDVVSNERGHKGPQHIMEKTLFLNDFNWHRRLTQELTRFVMSTASPNNPNSHIPTDAELQYQARWIVFDNDDPWNQTAADNDEWLQYFKRGVGIFPSILDLEGTP